MGKEIQKFGNLDNDRERREAIAKVRKVRNHSIDGWQGDRRDASADNAGWEY